TDVHGKTSAVTRRQSYCRKCRTEHAAEMRERRTQESTKTREGSTQVPSPFQSELESPASDTAGRAAEEVDDVSSPDESLSGPTLVAPVSAETAKDDGPTEAVAPGEVSLDVDAPGLERTPRQYRAPSARRPSAAPAPKTSTRKTPTISPVKTAT